MLRIVTITILIYSLTIWTGFAQEQTSDKDLVQLSGIVVANDSISPVFFANIYTLDRLNGTVSGLNGYFSLAVAKGDTVEFSAIGYQASRIVIDPDLKDDHQSIIQYLQIDTLLLPETVIYPYPTPLEFKQAFLELDLPDDDLVRARRNLEREKLRDLARALPHDGKELYSYQMRQHAQRMYSYGQLYPYRPIFDLTAWLEFLKALKNGDFKKEKQ